MFKYYKVSCINKECEEVFPGLNKYPSIFVYSLSSNRKITDYERINEYDEKDDLSELLLNKVSYLQLSEGEVENDEQFRKQVNEGLDKELRYSAAFFYDKFDFFNKLSYFLVSQ